MKHYTGLLATIAIIVTVLLSTSCATVPDPSTFPSDMTVVELSQKGQEALDRNRYVAARVYYQAIIDRFGTDSSALTAAEFEIAHTYIKQKNWTAAEPMLLTIIERYETTGGATLPPEYLVLAKTDISRIPEKK